MLREPTPELYPQKSEDPEIRKKKRTFLVISLINLFIFLVLLVMVRPYAIAVGAIFIGFGIGQLTFKDHISLYRFLIKVKPWVNILVGGLLIAIGIFIMVYYGYIQNDMLLPTLIQGG